MSLSTLALLLLLGPATAAPPKPAPPPPPGTYLSAMTWVQARDRLGPETVVVLPLGAGAKEHGPHLPLDADLRQATWLTARLVERADVVVAPAIPYGYYPAFVEYPGSTTTSIAASRDLVVDVVRSLAHHGPRRFYVVNVGVSTSKPLAEARALLRVEGIELRYLDLTSAGVRGAFHAVETQPEGTHADEIETSMMLAIDPSVVDLSKAVADVGAGKSPRGPLSPDPASPRPSPSGIYGDPTRATAEKGRAALAALVEIMGADVEAMRRAPPPEPERVFGDLFPSPVPWRPTSAGARPAP